MFSSLDFCEQLQNTRPATRSLRAGSRWSTSVRGIAARAKSCGEATRRESEPALISAIFLFPPRKPQKRISQLIFTGSMNLGSSDFLEKL